MTGYCTAQDVLDVMQDAEFTGSLASGNQENPVVKAIEAQSRWVEKQTRRHWYESGGVPDDDYSVVSSAVKNRTDEHDIPTHGAFVHGSSERPHFRIRENSDALLESGPAHDRHRQHLRREPKREIRISTGDSHALHYPVDGTAPAYTRIRLNRKDVSAINELSVINDAGGYDDWVADSGFDGGVGNSHRGKDYWIRINNEGQTEGYSDLYLDVHSMDDDITTFSNAVYVDIDYGKDSLTREVRQGVAHLVASDLVIDDEFVAQIPDSGQLINVETKSQRWERLGLQLLEPHFEEPIPQLS